MSKFGELIDHSVPVLLNFYTDWSEEQKPLHHILRGVSESMGDEAVVIKINMDKNKELSEALRIKSSPTFILYKHGDMMWRQSGFISLNELLLQIKKYA